MGLVLIRRPSDTPTVDGFDDARMMHYAVGGRRGITKGYANECSLSASGNTLTVGAGEIVVDGWQTVVDAAGAAVSVGGVPTGAYISVYAEFNMTAAENPIISIKTAYDTNTYPVISDGDDLISNPRGVARLVLWTCKKTASGVDTLARVAGVLESSLHTQLVTAFLDMIYPVGSIYMSVNNVSPQKFLGGTWEVWGAGRVPVSVGGEFNTVEEMGGKKSVRLEIGNIPSHTHIISGYNTTVSGSKTGLTSSSIYTGIRDVEETCNTEAAGMGTPIPISVLQPYITCYMWKRTA